MMLAEKLFSNPASFSEGWNFGSSLLEAKPVRYVIEKLINKFGEGKWKIDSNTHPQEAKYLSLDCTKARERLLWEPYLDLENGLDWTVDWVKAWQAGKAKAKSVNICPSSLFYKLLKCRGNYGVYIYPCTIFISAIAPIKGFRPF